MAFLLKIKANELEKLQNEASELVKTQSRASVNAVEVGSMYRLIPKKDAYILSLTASAEATKSEVDVYCSNVHFSQSMFHIGKSHDKLSEDIKKRFKVDVLERYAPEIAELKELGLLEVDDDILKLTPRGRLLGNEVFLRFLPESANGPQDP